MSDDHKYLEVLKEIGEILNKKNQYIDMKDYEVERLKRRLAEAEAIIEEITKQNETA